MPDTPFKSMGRDRDSERIKAWFPGTEAQYRFTACEKCGAMLAAGDWPWCKGDPREHER